MLSSSANDLCISLLVQSVDAEKLLKTLHTTVVGKDLDSPLEAEIFGLCWLKIQ